ncbi:MAG: uroporphyrinogen decarboxylase family protein [Candidatus Ornithomonoglobus sp.]
MNKRERVIAALENREPDFVPVGFWYHFPEDAQTGRACIDAHLDFYRKTNQDFIKIMCDGYFGYPNNTLINMKKVSDLYEMKPLGAGHPFIRGQVERAKAITSAVGDECCVFYNVFCPLSYFRLQVDWDNMMKCIREDKEAVKYACSVISEDATTLVEALINEAGCDGIYYCVQNAELFRFTAEEYREIVEPYDLKVLDHANSISKYNILHCCGWSGDKNRVEVWKAYKAAAVNWAIYVEAMDLCDGRSFFNTDCVLGGFDNRKNGVLYSGSYDEIREETKRLINAAGKRGTILGADCTLPNDIDLDRIRLVVDTVRTL